MTADADIGALQQALSGNRDVLPMLVDRWVPVIQARVMRVLRRHAAVAPARAFQEVEELVQQVLYALFENRSAALRAWQPERGLSLDNWVGLIAEQQVLSLLRTRKRNPWTEEPVVITELERRSAAPNPERETLDRDELDRLLERLQERLSPLGWRLFCLLYLEDQDVGAAARTSGLTLAAVYAWRSRLRRLAREVRDGLLSKNEDSSHRPLDEPSSEVTT